MLLLLFIIVSNFLLLTNCEGACKVPNTGTVLFRDIDVHRRHSWSREELALLYTRARLLDLVPAQIPHNIPLILEYIKICLTTLKEQVSSREVYDFMFAALADTFGGYLQTYGLPLLHEAYYEGYVSYDNAAEFHRLQDNFKAVLMTNGEGWTRPMVVRKHINRVLPLKLPNSASTKACPLLFSEASCHRSAADQLASGDNQSSTLIPLPILDDNKQPTALAIPFKTRALFNLKSRSSYDILIKYYIETSRCISQSQKSDSEQIEFDRAFSGWLKTKVEPHLKDETWYVGFSNVLRIQETIQQKSGMIGAGAEKEEESLFSELETEGRLTGPVYVAAAIILILSILFICFLYWAFIKHCIMCCGKVDVESSSGDSDRSSLLSNSDDVTPPSTGRGGRCPHKRKASDSRDQSARTVSEESKLTLGCGLGRGSRCRNPNRH